MTSKELRDAIKDPALLNLVCMLSTLDRIYDSLDGTVQMSGHYLIMLIYLLGFLLGILGREEVKFEMPRQITDVNLRGVSYLVLIGASLYLVYVVYEDLRYVNLW